MRTKESYHACVRDDWISAFLYGVPADNHCQALSHYLANDPCPLNAFAQLHQAYAEHSTRLAQVSLFHSFIRYKYAKTELIQMEWKANAFKSEVWVSNLRKWFDNSFQHACVLTAVGCLVSACRRLTYFGPLAWSAYGRLTSRCSNRTEGVYKHPTIIAANLTWITVSEF